VRDTTAQGKKPCIKFARRVRSALFRMAGNQSGPYSHFQIFDTTCLSWTYRWR